MVEIIRADGTEIVGLGLNSPPRPHSAEVRDVAGVDPRSVFYGRSFSSEVAVRRFAAAAPDLGICCGFGPIIPQRVLDLPRWGWVNVHRSYLPYNRGLDPLQWALVDGTPAGVTIHVMTDQVDAGDILAQVEMPLFPTDGYDNLERRSDRFVLELFRETWPRLRAGDLAGTPQDEDLATHHSLAECEALRKLDLNASMRVGRMLNILRAYSGSDCSGIEFGGGLVRAHFTVHTRIGILSEVEAPGNGEPARPDDSSHGQDAEPVTRSP